MCVHTNTPRSLVIRRVEISVWRGRAGVEISLEVNKRGELEIF